MSRTIDSFFDMLTDRLDRLAEEFARTQNRFEAVDRMGEDIRQLASKGAPSGVNSAKLAEQAAIKALQQVGPLAGGANDPALEAIIDGLKDDLHGLRRFAETSENATQQSLSGVSSMLNTIVDRLAKLEEQVRTGESSVQPAANFESTERGSNTEKASESESRGLGKLLRRRKAQEASGSAGNPSPAQTLSATELLKNRGMAPARQQADEAISRSRQAQSAQSAPAAGRTASPAAASATANAPSEGRKPGIFLSGKAVTASGNGEATARTPDRAGAPKVQPQFAGNVALKPQEQDVPIAKPRTARIVPGDQGPDASQTPAPKRDQGQSKADFIAAARRAAQAAAQESAKVEKEQGEASGFLSRFKGSKKASAKQGQEDVTPETTPEAAKTAPTNMSRKERRAAIAEAARMAKQLQKDQQNGLADSASSLEDSAIQLLEDEEASNSLLAKLGHTFSRHSRPLLMAAAAILLAITTIQLVQNPNSSLYSLFNSDAQQPQQSIQAPEMDKAPADDAAPAPQDTPSEPNNQSNITPSSGSLTPHMSDEEATRAIAFAQPNLADQGPAALANNATAAISNEEAMARAKAALNQQKDVGIDLTPTSAIPNQSEASYFGNAQTASAPQAEASVNPDPTSDTTAPSTENQTPIMKAALNNNVQALFELGRRYAVGEGVPTDLKTAATWFEKAANLNMPQAEYSLANLYEKGHGVKKDLQVARLWYQRAAEQGNVKSMHNLAVLYAEGGLGKPDFTEAAQWFLKAADHGLKDSQYNLAILFARGMGVKQDLLQSYKWFAIAAQQGDKSAAAKRDEIMGVLKGPQQKAAKALVAAWTQQIAKPSANEISSIPDEWAATTLDQLNGAQSGNALAPNLVAQAQSMLGALGYNAGPADGQMGPRTRMAIRNFQEIAGLEVTGKIDAALIKALKQRTI